MFWSVFSNVCWNHCLLLWAIQWLVGFHLKTVKSYPFSQYSSCWYALLHSISAPVLLHIDYVCQYYCIMGDHCLPLSSVSIIAQLLLTSMLYQQFSRLLVVGALTFTCQYYCRSIGHQCALFASLYNCWLSVWSILFHMYCGTTHVLCPYVYPLVTSVCLDL